MKQDHWVYQSQGIWQFVEESKHFYRWKNKFGYYQCFPKYEDPNTGKTHVIARKVYKNTSKVVSQHYD